MMSTLHVSVIASKSHYMVVYGILFSGMLPLMGFFYNNNVQVDPKTARCDV